jgi:gliding motility-associated lipoprotein GldH
MKKILIAIFGALLLVSCSNNNILDEERTFDRNVWNRFTPEEFDVSVLNIEDYYNIDITATVDTAVYRYKTLPLLIAIDAPNGEHRSFHAEVPLVENGRPRGSVSGSYRTADRRVRAFFSFNSTGDHHISVKQTTSQYDLEGIHSLKVTVSKAPLDYNI